MRFNFQTYEVWEDNSLIATIRDHEKNYWRHPHYVGGQTRFRIRIKAAGHTVDGPWKTFDMPGVTILNAECIDDNRVEIVWAKSQFDSAFSHYIIHRNSNAIHTSYDVSDTTYIDSTLIFGSNIGYNTSLYSISPSYMSSGTYIQHTMSI